MTKRKDTGVISIEKKYCENCGHDKAWFKPNGMYCTKCKHKHEYK